MAASHVSAAAAPVASASASRWTRRWSWSKAIIRSQNTSAASGSGERCTSFAAALGLELVAEVAGVAAGEVERQLGGIGAQAREFALAEREERSPAAPRARRPLDRERAGGDVVAHDVAERAVGRAHEREAREAGLHPCAVEPHGVLAVAVERDERGLGVAPRLERAMDDPDPGGRSGARRAERRRSRVRSRKLRTSARPCSVEIDSGWNCTPHSGRVRCSSPITTWSGVHAVTRSDGGTAPTTSEW